MGLSQHVALWHLDVVEEQLCGVLGLETKFVQIAASLKALPTRLDKKQGHRVWVVLRIRLGGDND